MVEITKNFTYNLADDYLAQTSSLNKTADWTYIGPDKIWILVNNETNRCDDFNILTKENDGETYPTPEGYTKVELDCNANPLIATLFRANINTIDSATLPQLEINLPNGDVYSRPQNPDPWHTYETSELTYVEGQWNLSWKKPWITWEEITKAKNDLILRAKLDQKNIIDLPDILKNKLANYITTLETLETTWAEFQPYMVILPDYPL